MITCWSFASVYPRRISVRGMLVLLSLMFIGTAYASQIQIGERNYSYDANGNQTGWTQQKNGTNRSIVWDDDNRIQAIADNGHTKSYQYDDQGVPSNRPLHDSKPLTLLFLNHKSTSMDTMTGHIKPFPVSVVNFSSATSPVFRFVPRFVPANTIYRGQRFLSRPRTSIAQAIPRQQSTPRLKPAQRLRGIRIRINTIPSLGRRAPRQVLMRTHCVVPTTELAQ
jgi:hypothetical protein